MIPVEPVGASFSVFLLIYGFGLRYARKNIFKLEKMSQAAFGRFFICGALGSLEPFKIPPARRLQSSRESRLIAI
jgi:hypothetical protein